MAIDPKTTSEIAEPQQREAPAARPEPLYFEFLGGEDPLPKWKEWLQIGYHLTLGRLIQRLASVVTNDQRISETSQITVSQLDIYRNSFNQEGNGCLLLSAQFSRIEPEHSGKNWTIADRLDPVATPHLLRWMLDIQLLRKADNQEGWEIRREELVASGIRRLILPININGDHWAAIHVDLENRKIEYYDSQGPGDARYYSLIRLRLYQVQDWMARMDNEHHYPLIPEGGNHESPSSIKNRQQWDSFSCGCFLTHYGFLRGQGLSNSTINQMTFLDTQRHIRARRKEMRFRVDQHLSL